MTSSLEPPWAPYRLIQPEDRPDYRELIAHVAWQAWPEFMLQDPIAERHWDDLYTRFAGYQFCLLAPQDDTVIGIGNSVPLSWEGELADLPEEGWDWAIAQAMADHAAGLRSRIHCALQIALPPSSQSKGISSLMVQAMRRISAANGFNQLIAPVRPSLKSRYPLASIDQYVEWETAEGLPFDPWLRVHARLGARIVKVCHRAMRITGTVAEWERWTRMRFPETGPYVAPGALVPIDVDVEADQVTYVEPNVWMVHDLSRDRKP